MNFQNWSGMSDTRYGYGALRAGFRDHAPEGVTFDERASSLVYMGLPDHFPGKLAGVDATLLTMVETDCVPESWLPFVAEFDRVVVPCQANLRVFGKLHPNVSVVPLGVDRAVWFPKPREPNARFRFHCGGSLWSRKGLDLVLEAFLGLGLDAELHIKVAPHIMDMPRGVRDLPDNVFVYRSWMTDLDVVAWFRRADCFVAPSRGEGFGLMGLQAIACGIPTILSATSGHLEYAGLAIHTVPTVPVPCPAGGMWDEVNVTDLAAAMSVIYSNAVEARTAALARAPMVANFSWENAAMGLLHTVPVGVLVADGAPYVPCQPLVPITVNTNCNPDIAGVRYRFRANQMYTVPVNVREVLYGSGFLIV